MSKAVKRKFGVKRIGRFNRDLICNECGQRAGLHYGNGEDCPKFDIRTGKPFKK